MNTRDFIALLQNNTCNRELGSSLKDWLTFTEDHWTQEAVVRVTNTGETRPASSMKLIHDPYTKKVYAITGTGVGDEIDISWVTDIFNLTEEEEFLLDPDIIQVFESVKTAKKVYIY